MSVISVERPSVHKLLRTGRDVRSIRQGDMKGNQVS